MERKNLALMMRSLAVFSAVVLFIGIGLQHNQLRHKMEHDEESILIQVSNMLLESSALSQGKWVAAQDKLQLQTFVDYMAYHPAILNIKLYDIEANLLAENASDMSIKQRILAQDGPRGVIVKSMPIQLEDEHLGYITLLIDYDAMLRNTTAQAASIMRHTLPLLFGSALVGFLLALGIPFTAVTGKIKQTLNRTPND